MSRALYLGYVWPEPRSSAAGVRTLQCLRGLKASGFEVIFATHSAPTQFCVDAYALRQEGIESQAITLNCGSLNDWVRALKPDVVIFDRFISEEQFGFRVREACPSALRVIDTQDFHSLRTSRQSGDMAIPWDETYLLRELSSYLRSDLNVMISATETALLQNQFQIPNAKLTTLGLGYPEIKGLPVVDRDGLYWIGNFRHPPNAQAVGWILDELWPEIIRAIPNAKLKVMGAYAPESLVARLSKAKGVQWLGHVDQDTARAVIASSRALFAPLIQGAGLKGKIIQAWSAGTPVITTAVGAEGLNGDFGGWVVNEAGTLVNAAKQVLLEAADWQKASDQADFVYQRHHRPGPIQEQWGSTIRAALQDLDRLRKGDFLGKILWQQQLRSTEYFSKWIELKGARRN